MKKGNKQKIPPAELSAIAKSGGLDVDRRTGSAKRTASRSAEPSRGETRAFRNGNSGNGDVISAKFHEQETAKLQAELNRKGKALAEAAAPSFCKKTSEILGG